MSIHMECRLGEGGGRFDFAGEVENLERRLVGGTVWVSDEGAWGQVYDDDDDDDDHHACWTWKPFYHNDWPLLIFSNPVGKSYTE